MDSCSGAWASQVQEAPARQSWPEMLLALPGGWLVAVTVIGVVGLVVAGWLMAKRMDNKLTANIVRDHGPGTLRDLVEHHRVSSMTVVAEVLRAAAEVAKAGRDDGGRGDSSPPGG